MACEIKPWRGDGLAFGTDIPQITSRPGHSDEINKKYGGGGGGNFSFTVVEAVGKVCNVLGYAGYVYGEDFIWKTGGTFDCCDLKTRRAIEEVLRQNFGDKVIVAT